MRLANIFSALSLATLALAIPTSDDRANAKDIPWGAFPSSSTTAVPYPTATPIPIPTQTPTSTPNVSERLGRAVIVNRCTVPIYIWSVGSTVRPQSTIYPYGRFFENYRRDMETGGIALKVSTVHDGLYNSSPMTVFAYNLANGKVWYDLSDVFGDPFAGHPVALQPSEPQISWQNGIPPSGSMVRVQDASVDLVLTVC